MGTERGQPAVSELTSMMNIGREIVRKLTSVGIDSPEKLLEAGAKEAYFRMKQIYPQICLVHLYALEGAIQRTEFNRLTVEKKKELQEFSGAVKW